jgi:FMN-dependent NADH-azoreductase
MSFSENYIEGSAGKARSASIEVAAEALAAWRAADSTPTVDTLDVWSEELPDFDGPVMEAKYAAPSGTPLTRNRHRRLRAGRLSIRSKPS